MTTISTLQQDFYSTPLSVRLCNEALQSTNENSTIKADNSRILYAIHFATSEVKSYLYRIYGDDDLITTPVALPPIVPKTDPYSNITENTGSGVLYGIVPSSSAKTETWTITFSSATAFTVIGSRSGSQGSGTKGTEFISTNTWITIPADVFSGTPADGDVFYIDVIHAYPLVHYITTLKAAAFVNRSIFSTIAPNENPIADSLDTISTNLLERLNKGHLEKDVPLRLASFSYDDLSEEANPFYIDEFGNDLSNYTSNERPPIITGNNLAVNHSPFWYGW